MDLVIGFYPLLMEALGAFGVYFTLFDLVVIN